MEEEITTLKKIIDTMSIKFTELDARVQYLENVNKGYDVCPKCKTVLCTNRGCCVVHICNCASKPQSFHFG